MTITDEARDQLRPLIRDNHADGILAIWMNGACGRKPLFRLCVFEEGDQPETINDIPVLIPDDLKASLEDATLSWIQNHLILQNGRCHCNSSQPCNS